MKKQSPSQSAFFNPRVLLSLLLCAMGAFLMLLGFEGAAQGANKNAILFQSVASYHNDRSAPVRDLALLPARKSPRDEDNLNPKIPFHHKDAPDRVIQSRKATSEQLGPIAPSMPNSILNFLGIGYPGVGCNCHPPDTNGAVGATQYVQIVNEGYQVFNKTTGAPVIPAVSISSIWSGFGGVCENNGAGDPVVLYDHLANRWVISQFAGSGSAVTDECVAVSTTSDATGTYNRYGFHLGTNFFDYPKLAVWPDAYYMSMNVFNAAGTAYLGPQPFALNRNAMLTGAPATFVSPVAPLGSSVDPILPADLDGATLPANDAPETFVGFPGFGQYTTYHFHVDFATPGNSSWSVFATPAAAAFTQLCSSTQACVPELGVSTGDYLDGLADRLMFRLAYRNFGDHESVVGNFTVNAGGVAGIRWFELRNVTAGPVTVFQESTYQPDTTWRWMGSVAMDGAGNMALGYSASSATINPGIRYAGRLAGDPLNTLAQGETTLVAGTGSQTGSGNRWGDYSAMTVDPVDDRTFWFTTEYYTSTGGSWQTRIGSFKFPNAPSPIPDTQSVTADSCNSNGVIDPNESVTVSLGIKNTGPIATSNLVATLQATGGVTSPSGPQNYGALAPGASTAMSFNFTAGNLACGAPLVATLQLQDGATNFGTITYTFTVGSPGAPATASYSSGNTAVAIPDNNTTGVDIPITINDTGSVVDVNVTVRLNHTWDGDLQLSLIAPDNTTVPLVTNRGGSGDNFGTGNNDCSATPTTFDDQASTAISAGAAPFAATFKPESPLSLMNGKSITGTWKLHVVDSAAVDVGIVGCFTVQITRQTFSCCGVSPTPTPTPTATPTPTPTPTPGPAGAVISEFRTRGPAGGNDEFIEIYNSSNSPIDISGWKIKGSNNAGATSVRVTVAASTSLPAHAHFLATNAAAAGYTGSVAGDQTYTTGITDDGGIALTLPNDTLVDQVGMSAGSAYKEGTTLAPLTATGTNQGYERKPGGASGSTQDTNNNASDFIVTAPSDPQDLASKPTPASAAPQITNGPPPSPVIVGAPYSFSFTATGNPPPTFSFTGTLPPGLGLSPAGVLSGTATSGGTGSFPGITVTASNGTTPDATQSIALTTATRATNYLAGFGLTGANAVYTFDFDGDGIANLLEYGLDLDPTIAGLNGLPVVTLKDYSGIEYLSMTFTRSSLATDLTYIVQGSSDLTNWTDLGTSSGGLATSGAGFITETGSAPTFTVEVRDIVPYDPSAVGKRFIRLKITSP